MGLVFTTSLGELKNGNIPGTEFTKAKNVLCDFVYDLPHVTPQS